MDNIRAHDKEFLAETASTNKQHLAKHYQPGFGVFPCGDRSENYYGQVWTRDFAHAAGNYFAQAEPQALTDSLETIFKHQKPNGMLPLRVERNYALLKIPPLTKPLARPLFKLIEENIRGRAERPVYEGQDFSGAEDTVPAALVSCGEFFLASEQGREFASRHYEQLQKAAEFFENSKVDGADGLAAVHRLNPDWADSLKRSGKLGGVNVWWARALQLMQLITNELGRAEDAGRYQEKYNKTKQSILRQIYNADQGYFRAAADDDRLDTAASVFGALYLLDAEQAARVEQSLTQRVRHSSGLQNFDPPYPQQQIFLIAKLSGHGGYHNEFVWPWVTCQNIEVKIKIALQHPDQAVQNRYKQEAVDDLLQAARLFQTAGGAYEIFLPDQPVPARTPFYRPPKNFMGSMAAYLGAYEQLRSLGWI